MFGEELASLLARLSAINRLFAIRGTALGSALAALLLARDCSRKSTLGFPPALATQPQHPGSLVVNHGFYYTSGKFVYG